MSIISIRRVRDAFVRAEVTDQAKGLELATDLDEALSEKIVSNERLETLEERLNARFAEQDARMDARFGEQNARMEARFAQAETYAERRMMRFLLAVIAAQALFAAVIAILVAVL